jgi:tetratricopeptide (TPR) repeat protein
MRLSIAFPSWERALAALLLLAPAPALAGVSFIEGDLGRALAEAKAGRRAVMVDVYAGWCSPCKELESNVFATREAEEGLKGFISVRLDAEAGEGPAFVEKHNVVGYPTVLFLTPEGEEIDRIFGSMPVGDFVRTARGYVGGQGTLQDSERRFLDDRGADLELAYDLLFRHATRGDEKAALAYQRIIESARAGLVRSPPGDQVAHASLERLTKLTAQARYALGKYLYLRGQKDYGRARDMLLSLRRDFPKSELASAALFDLAWAYDGLGQRDKTRESLERFHAESGESASSASAWAWFSYRHRFQMDRGIAVARAALAEQPKNHELWDTLSELYAAQGDKAQALAANARALELMPADPYYAAQKKRFQALP